MSAESSSRPARPRLPARKRWGQHFLASPETARRIVDAARVGPDDCVLEIGPGDGALTHILAERARRVVAVEIDPLRAEALAAQFKGVQFEADPDAKVAILPGDALERPPADWLAEGGCAGGGILVANLPYNVATPILFAALESRDRIRRAVATVQREVAHRFVASPGDEGYGYLSVRAAALADGRILFDLPPGAFRPRPKVMSSVLELVPRPDPLPPPLARRALTLASLGFNARRKTLPNALSSAASREFWEAKLSGIGKSARVRAEELSLDDFVALARDWPGPPV
jgi:16S rRNA (adenine1518-N6/adenine1519-N6)-dimethyltransferase